MALTILEQLEITKGNVAPENYSLSEIVHQSARDFGVTFTENYNSLALNGSIVNGEFVYDNPDAAAYVNKMLNASQRAFRPRNNEIVDLQNVLITILGDMAVTFAQVQNATDEQWATFVQGNVQKALEIITGVRQAEKTAYEAL